MTDSHLLSNQPPPEESAGMEISTELAGWEKRRDEIAGALGEDRLVVNDEATVGKTADKIMIAKTFLRDVDAVRMRIKGPWDRAATVVDSRTAAFVEEVRAGVDRAYARIRAFRAECRQRAADQLREQREEEARLEALAGRKLPEETAAETAGVEFIPTNQEVSEADIVLPVARGDLGSKVHGGKAKVYEILDPRQLPDEILNAPKVREAMLTAVRQLAKLRADIPGVRATDAATDTVRRAG